MKDFLRLYVQTSVCGRGGLYKADQTFIQSKY